MTDVVEFLHCRGITYRDVLEKKVNAETLFLYDLLRSHTDEPKRLLREVLDRIGGQTIYLPAVRTVERCEAWIRLRGGENMIEVAEDMQNLTGPMEVRRVAHQPLDEF